MYDKIGDTCTKCCTADVIDTFSRVSPTVKKKEGVWQRRWNRTGEGNEK